MLGTRNDFSSQSLPGNTSVIADFRRNYSALHGADVLCSTLSSSGVGKLCYPHYSLDGSARCTLFRRDLNDVYLVTTPARKYALKVYQSGWRTPDAILTEVRAIRHLVAKGIDVPRPVPRVDGEWITEIPAPEGRRSAVAFEWVEGETPKYSEPGHSAQLGALIGRLHTAADDIPCSDARPQMTIHHLMEESLVCIQEALEGAPQLNRRCEAVVQRTRAWLAGSQARLEDWGFCHGDLFLNNARIVDGRMVLLDFDWSGFGWRVFDIATYRWMVCLNNTEKLAWRPFIDAYLAARPSAEASLPFIGVFVVLRHLWHMTQCIRRASAIGAMVLSDDYSFESLVSQCERMEMERDLT